MDRWTLADNLAVIHMPPFEKNEGMKQTKKAQLILFLYLLKTAHFLT